jgi:hypothetical protein
MSELTEWKIDIDFSGASFWDTPALPGGIKCTVCGKPAVSCEGTCDGLKPIDDNSAELINPQMTGYCEEHTPPRLLEDENV